MCGDLDLQGFEQQANAVLHQANPVSGTKYTVLETKRNVRIIFIGVSVTWTVQPSPLEIHLTVDGNTITFTQADPVSEGWYDAYFVYYADDLHQGFNYMSQYRAFLLEGRSVKIEAETTGGTVQSLDARVKYAKL